MSIFGRLAKLEKVAEAQRRANAPTPLQYDTVSFNAVLCRMRDTLPEDVAGTLELTEALFKAAVVKLPADTGWLEGHRDEFYLRAEDRAALATWRGRCAGLSWANVPPADAGCFKIAAPFLFDWNVYLALREQWKHTGNLAEGTPEREQYFETAKRGDELWQWGGWTMIGLPPDWCTGIPPDGVALPVLSALVALAEAE